MRHFLSMVFLILFFINTGGASFSQAKYRWVLLPTGDSPYSLVQKVKAGQLRHEHQVAVSLVDDKRVVPPRLGHHQRRTGPATSLDPLQQLFEMGQFPVKVGALGFQLLRQNFEEMIIQGVVQVAHFPVIFVVLLREVPHRFFLVGVEWNVEDVLHRPAELMFQ